jgi:hypothetical protein
MESPCGYCVGLRSSRVNVRLDILYRPNGEIQLGFVTPQGGSPRMPLRAHYKPRPQGKRIKFKADSHEFREFRENNNCKAG